MDRRRAAQLWDANADAWTALARAGYDVYRDAFNTPAFLQMLPAVRGLCGLDIGCGEGSNTRLIADLGARVTGVDVSRRFVRHALATERADARGVRHGVADVVALPFPDATFDFATAFMSLMDVPGKPEAIGEVFRVLRPGGFFQFSICHPCFDTPHRVNRRDATGRTVAIEVGDYFRAMDGEVLEWTFSSAPPEATAGLAPFRVARFHSTLTEWLNAVIDAGFRIERTAEPTPDADAVARWPGVQDATVVAYFFHLRARRPTAERATGPAARDASSAWQR